MWILELKKMTIFAQIDQKMTIFAQIDQKNLYKLYKND